MAEKTKKIRHRNKYLQAVQAQIDLHGLTRLEAQEAFGYFLENAKNKKYSYVRVITGKGLHSEDGQCILNGCIKNMLDKEGLKYSDAKLYDGGSGAIDIRL